MTGKTHSIQAGVSNTTVLKTQEKTGKCYTKNELKRKRTKQNRRLTKQDIKEQEGKRDWSCLVVRWFLVPHFLQHCPAALPPFFIILLLLILLLYRGLRSFLFPIPTKRDYALINICKKVILNWENTVMRKSEVPEPTPVPTKLGRLRLQAKKAAPYSNIFHFELLKSELLSHLPL